MAEQLKSALGEDRIEVGLVHGVSSQFDVSANGELVFSRIQERRFPELEDITRRIADGAGS